MINIAPRRRDDKFGGESKFAGFTQSQTTTQAPPSRGGNAPYKYSPDDFEEIKEDSLTRLKQTHSGAKPVPIPKDGDFESFPEITPRTVDKLKAKGIVSLFPIQQYCFHTIYNREDMMARDLTGSGKTLAFCLPIVEYLRKNRLLGTRKIQAMILAPTRELAIQVSEN